MHAADDVFDPVDAKVAVQAEILDPVPEGGRDSLSWAEAAAAGGRRPPRCRSTQCRPRVAQMGEDVEFQVAGQALARPDSPHAVPLFVEDGEKTPMPKRPGSTAMMPPPTPLFAGMPTS